MFFARKKRRPIWQPTRLERIRRAVSGVTIPWKRLLSALILIVFAGVILSELLISVVLIGPISVPKPLEEQGFTGQVVAAKVKDQIASMEEAVKYTKRDQLRLSSDSLPDVEVPEIKVSLPSFIQLLQVFLHRQPPRIRAEIVCLQPSCGSEAGLDAASSEKLEVTYRFTDGKAFLVPIRLRALDIDDAVKRLSRLVLTQINPYVMGMYEYEVDHDPAASLQTLEECANSKDYSHRPAAFNAWGSVLADLGRLDEAIAKYQRAIELEPMGAYPYVNWGNALQQEGKLDEAIEKYQKAIALDPKFVSPYVNWGNVLDERGKLDEATAKYRKAIEIDPKSDLPYYNWGLALQRRGKLDEALAKYQKAIEVNPKNAIAYNNWGNTLADQGKLDEAATKYQKAIELYPEFALTYSNWATTLRRQGKLDEALAKYQKAIKLEPRYADAYIGWGNVLGDQDKLDEAATKYQKAIELNPKSALAYRNLALSLRQQGKAHEAEADEKKAEELELITPHH
jgi:tetratricopeptide (TPR) repeat protein